MNLTAPSFFTATCVSCEAPRTFQLTDGDTTGGIGYYTCEECGHEAKLDLTP